MSVRAIMRHSLQISQMILSFRLANQKPMNVGSANILSLHRIARGLMGRDETVRAIKVLVSVVHRVDV